MVHGVDMDMLYTIGDQVHDLFTGVDDACLLHGSRAGSEIIYDSPEAFRDVGAGQLDAAAKLRRVGDGHDAGQNRHLDTGLADAVEKIVEDVVVKEHLGRQEIAAAVHL